jgi:hypothetical protein
MLILLRDFDLTPSHKSCLAPMSPIAPMRPSSRDGDSICMDELVCLVGMQPVSHTYCIDDDKHEITVLNIGAVSV